MNCADNSKGSKTNYARDEFPADTSAENLPLLDNAFKIAAASRIGVFDFVHANLVFFRKNWEEVKANESEEYQNAKTFEETEKFKSAMENLK